MRNYLAELLADLVDEEHLSLAIQLDVHMRQQWEQASPELKEILAKFESKSSNDTAVELVMYVALMEAMLDDIRTKQGDRGIQVSKVD